jgi:hypothetical protein
MRIYARSTRTGLALFRVFLLYRVDDRIHAYSTRTAPFRAAAEVWANYRGGVLGPELSPGPPDETDETDERTANSQQAGSNHE